MTKYQLMYFDAMGRAEVIRVMFAYKQIEYEDIRLMKEWPERKQETPFGQMPVLIVNGKEKIAQSGAIARYLARELNLGLADSLQQAKVEMFADVLVDVVDKLPYMAENKEEATKEALKKIEPLMTSIQNQFAKGGGSYLVGNTMTFADIFLMCVADTVELFQPGYVKANFAALQSLREKVAANENIAKWLKSRPCTPM